MTTIAQIQLSHLSKRMDIPRVLCAIDAFDEAASKRLEDLFYKAKLIDLHYQMVIYTESKQRKRLSAESRLNRRLKELEKRAQKASGLFWQEIVDSEIAKRPDYYTLEGVKKTMDEIEKYLADSEIKHTPAFTLDGLRDWLRKHSPFINPDLDRLMAFRYQCLERQKQINAMTPVEREEYLAQRRDNDPIAKKAFEAEGEREMLNLMRI